MRPVRVTLPVATVCLAAALATCGGPSVPSHPDVSGLRASARRASEEGAAGKATAFALTAFRGHPGAATELDLRSACGNDGWRLGTQPGLTTASVAVAPTGSLIGTGARDAIARLWQPGAVGVLPQGVRRGHAARILDLAVLEDGTLLTGSADGTALLHASDGSVETRLAGHEHPVVSVAMDWHGDRLLTVSLDGLARVWSRDGTLLVSTGSPSAPVSRAESFSSGKAVVAASRAAGTLVVASVDSDRVRKVAGLGESAERFSVAAGKDDVVVGSLDGTVRRLRGPGEFEVLGTMGAQVLGTALSANGSIVAAASLDGTVRIWSDSGSDPLELRHPAAVHAVALSAHAPTRTFVTVAYDRTVRVWNPAGEEIASYPGGYTSVRYSPENDRFVVWGDRAGPALLLQDGQVRARLGATDRGLIDARFTADGKYLVVLAPDRVARVYPADIDSLLAHAEAVATDVPSAEIRAAREALPADPLPPPTVSKAGPSPVDDYTDSVRCARCHRPEYERWIASSHAWTSALAGPRTLPREVLAGATVDHEPGSTRFGTDDDGYWAETVGTSGAQERFRLTHVAGHKRMRMFLTTLDDGRIQVLPGMVELPDDRWFDYTHLLFGRPGTDPGPAPVVPPGEASFWTGVVRSWDHRCAVCHTSGRLARAPDEDGNGPRSDWRSLGVDCETCHGPGRAHSDAWERGETGTELHRLERFERDASIAVCTQCHMEGDRITPAYTLGEDLLEHLDPTLLLDPQRVDPYGRPLELIYDGLPFGTSHCAESGGLTCSKCHEPHGSAVRSQLREEPRAGSLCTDCHLDIVRDAAGHSHHEAPGPGSSCILCHLPFSTIERGHGAVADHTIGVPVPGAPGDRVAVDACTWCHTGGRGAPPGAPELTAEQIGDAYVSWWPGAGVPRPWMKAVAAARAGEPDAGPGLVAAAEDTSNPRLVRGSAARLLDRYTAGHVEDLLRLSRDDDSLVRRSALAALAAVNHESADARLLEALADPSRAVRVSAARAALAGWWRVRRNAKLLTAVLPVLEEDVASIPDDYYRWFLLGSARGLAGDDAGALAAFERVLTLDPLAHAVRQHVKTLRERLARGE